MLRGDWFDPLAHYAASRMIRHLDLDRNVFRVQRFVSVVAHFFRNPRTGENDVPLLKMILAVP